MYFPPPQIQPVPAGLRAAASLAGASRGRVREFQRLFERSLIPMIVVDNDRRYREVNVPARLLFRLSLRDMRRRRIEDLTAPRDLTMLTGAWETLMLEGAVSGSYDIDFPTRFRIHYTAIANFLPGLHLIVFAPAGWPEEELPQLPQSPAPGQQQPLSDRQRSVVQLLSAGADLAQIASELGIAESTARTHVRDALLRLGARNRAHAVALALAMGLIMPDARPRALTDERG